MKFTRSTIRCSAVGLTEEQARQSLYQSGRIQPGDEVGPLVEQSGFWTASVYSPAPKVKKVASPPFPPNNDNEESESAPKSEAPDDSSSDSEGDGGSESKPEGPPSDSKPKPKGESSGGGGEVVELLHQILNLLAPAGPMGPGAGGPMPPPPGAGGPPPGPGGPMGGPPPGGPPMGGPPGGAPGGTPNHRIQEVIHKRVMKPGEAAPGQTPIGAPALASVPISSLGHMTAVTNGEGITLSQAKDNLTTSYGPHGYKVEQIKRVAATNEIAALLVKHA